MRLPIAPAVLIGAALLVGVPSAAERERSEEQSASASDLLARIKRTVREPDTAARNARIAPLADQLDRLPDTELDTKIEGHFALLTVDATVERHARWLIATAKTWDPARRKKYASRLPNSYVELAQVLAQDGRNDEALALLRRAAIDVPDAPAASRAVADLLNRLELIGTVGVPLTAPRWLNMPPATTSLDLKGKVTLIEFSAHWCGPCTESYPALNRFRKAFGGRGFQAVIVTELYGYFGADKSLTPDDELARDRTYFAKHLPEVPVAIGNKVTVNFDGENTTYSPARDPNHLHYRVGALPQFYLVDRQGRIRYIAGGYGKGSEAKLLKLIRILVSESGGPGVPASTSQLSRTATKRVTGTPARSAPSYGAVRFDGPPDALANAPQTGQGAGPLWCDVEHATPLAAPDLRRLTQVRPHISFGFKTRERGIDRTHGDVPARRLLHKPLDGHAVRLAFDGADGEQGEFFEFSEAVAFHCRAAWAEAHALHSC